MTPVLELYEFTFEFIVIFELELEFTIGVDSGKMLDTEFITFVAAFFTEFVPAVSEFVTFVNTFDPEAISILVRQES